MEWTIQGGTPEEGRMGVESTGRTGGEGAENTKVTAGEGAGWGGKYISDRRRRGGLGWKIHD